MDYLEKELIYFITALSANYTFVNFNTKYLTIENNSLVITSNNNTIRWNIVSNNDYTYYIKCGKYYLSSNIQVYLTTVTNEQIKWMFIKYVVQSIYIINMQNLYLKCDPFNNLFMTQKISKWCKWRIQLHNMPIINVPKFNTTNNIKTISSIQKKYLETQYKKDITIYNKYKNMQLIERLL